MRRRDLLAAVGGAAAFPTFVAAAADKPFRAEAVGKRVYDLGDALGFLAVTVEAPVDIGSAA